MSGSFGAVSPNLLVCNFDGNIFPASVLNELEFLVEQLMKAQEAPQSTGWEHC